MNKIHRARIAARVAQRLVLGLFLLAGSGQAQTVVGDHETLAFDRPEAWAMNFLAATTFLTAFGESPRLAPWQWSIAGELGHIPHLSEAQRRIGFEGMKIEDLNKSPVFGRIRFMLALPSDWLVEFAYTPSIQINGARPSDLVAFALGRRLVEGNSWTLSARAFTQGGSVRGDITCPAALVNVADPDRNPFGCRAPSNDRLALDYYGVDLTAGWNVREWHGHAGLGIVRTELGVQVDALTQGFRDRTHLTARGVPHYLVLGGHYDLSRRWTLGTEILHVPLNVRRARAGARESDRLTSLRIQVRFRSD